jgi:toluene monooxygenase system ferredoxin subunit
MSESFEYQRACDLDDIWEGEMESVDVGGRDVLIVHAEGGEVRAYDPMCPHQEFPLIDGELENCVITCSAHLWQFNAISGMGINPEGASLTSYPVKIEDNVIFVSLPNKV